MKWRKLYVLCFFFQAEDGIRGADVTGVQTCALPICRRPPGRCRRRSRNARSARSRRGGPLPGRARIENVAQPVPEQAERERAEEDRQAWIEGEAWCGA